MSFIKKLFSKDEGEIKNSKSQKLKSESMISPTFDLLRVSPTSTKTINPNTDRLTDLIIVLFIFGIAVWFRFLVRSLYINNYTSLVFDLQINEIDPLGFGKFLGLKKDEVANTEGYHDFYRYYIPYVNAYEKGWNPYLGSDDPDSPINGYVYGPFYVVSIAIGKLWFNLSTENSIVYSNIIFDALSYVMVYVLGKRVTGNLVAMLVAILGSFSPISLFYIAFRGLNAPIMNFTFLIFIYYYLEKRDTLAMFFLSFSILTKQFPMFILMPLGLWFIRRHGVLKGLGLYLQGAIFLLIQSIPYILTTPWPYVVRFFLPGGGKSSISCPIPGEATNLVHARIPVDACPTNSGDLIQLSLLPEFIDFWFLLVNSHILFILGLTIVAWIGFTGFDYLEENPRLYYVFFAGYYFIAHATIARGIFKYYMTFLIPLMVLAFMRGSLTKSLHLRLGAGLHHNWKMLLHPKYRQKEPTTYYWIYFLIVVISTVSIFIVLSWPISIIDTYIGNPIIWGLIVFPLALYFIIKPTPGNNDDFGNENNKSYQKISNFRYRSIGLFVFVIIISRYFLILADYYFESNSSLIFRYYNLGVFFTIVILSLNFFESKVTKKDNSFQFYSFNLQQILIDAIWIFLGLVVIIQFHIQLLLVHRHFTTLIVLMYSFIFLAMLGNDIWTSAIRVPLNFIRQVRRIYYLV